MAVGTYQLPNPQALDPYPIESELVKDTASPLAMLAMYRSDRHLQQQGYDQELASQHDFAKQQLANQMHEAMAKNLVDLAKVPGGVDFAAQSGVGFDVGADPAALARWGQATNLAQAAENFNKGATGFQHASEGGFLANPEMVPGLAGVQGTLTDTSRVRAAQIQAASHAATAGAGKEQKLAFSQQLPVDPVSGLPTTVSGTVPASQHPAYTEWSQNYARWLTNRNAGLDAGPMPQPPGVGGKTALPPAPAPSVQPTTSAPPAKAGTPAATSATSPGVKTSSPVGADAQNTVMRAVAALKAKGDAASLAKAKDIQDGMNGAVYRVERGADGRMVVRGKSGTHPF